MEDGDLAWSLQPQPYLRFQPLTVFWLQSEGGWLSIALVPNAISGETLCGRSASPGRKGELERLDQGTWSKITREYAKYYAVPCEAAAGPGEFGRQWKPRRETCAWQASEFQPSAPA